MANKTTIKKEEPQTMATQSEKGTNTFLKNIESKKLILAIFVILALGGASGSWYFYGKYQAIKKNPNGQAQKATGDIVAAVGKLIQLPEDEVPTVATISDVTKLADQPFFKLAENGDVLLAYTKTKEAILYRPKTNKIISVAPINMDQSQNLTQGAKQGTPQPTPPISGE